jgi:phage terminase large subunit
VALQPFTSASAEKVAEWRRSPSTMVRELFKAEPDPWQHDVLSAFADPVDPQKRRIAMPASAGPGKSAVLAWCGWNFLLCYSEKGHHPVGACVSISGDNLRDGLWKELAHWRQQSPLLIKFFEQTSQSIFAREFQKTWYLNARTFSKSADAEAQGRTLSGLHAKRILYLVDESGDMPPSVTRTAEQGLSNCEWGKILQAGNTTSQLGALHRAVAEERHLWTVINITGDPDDPRRSPRISLEWAKQQIDLYGRDNPWVMAFVLGKFPPGAINALLTSDEINAALGRGLRAEDYEHVQKRIGIDVARFGDDRTVLFPRQGLRAFKPVTMRNARGPEIAARVARAKATWGSEAEFIDDTGGWGASTIDAALLGGLALLPVNSSSGATDPRFFNRRSEMHFRAAEWVKRGGCLPQGLTSIVREALAVTYWFDKGRLRVTEKDQIKIVLNGTSPDEWDALCLTFAVPDVPASLQTVPGTVGYALTHAIPQTQLVTDWDPFAEKVA